MKNKRLFLHVGTNKAASTSLQQFFSMFNALDGEHHYLVDEYRLGQDVAEHHDNDRLQRVVKRRVAKKISDSPRKRIIVSSENFWTPLRKGNRSLSKKIIKTTNDLFDFIPTRILIVFRRQDTYLESGYVWRLKAVMNYRERFGAYLSKLNPQAFDWLTMTMYWEKIFGRENIHVVPFELLKHDRPLFLQRVMNFLGYQVDNDFDMEFPRSNTAISEEGVEYALRHPATLQTKDEQKTFRHHLETQFPASKGTKPVFFNHPERSDFLQQYQEANRTLLDRYAYDPTIWDLST